MGKTPKHFLEKIREAKEKQLKRLDLSNDWNTDNNKKLTEIPAEVFELEWLEVLNLSGNQLTTLPEAIAHLQQLNFLNLSFNKLTTLPEAIAHLPQLTSLLTKQNIDHISEIYQFYRDMEISARILPLFHGAFENQHQGFEISAYDTLEAYKKLVDLWLADDKFVWISPIREAIQSVIYQYSPDAPTAFYDKREWESIYIVDLDGEVYSYADAYEINRSHGNIFTSPLSVLISSSNHRQVLDVAEQRMMAVCGGCKFFGSCNGYPIAEGSRDYNDLDERDPNRCIVDRGILYYIEYRLIEAGLIDLEAGVAIGDKLKFTGQISPNLAYV